MISHDSRFYDSHHSPALRAAAVVRMRRVELIACPRETAQPHALGAVVNLQMGKAHLKRMVKSWGYFSYWNEVSSMS